MNTDELRGESRAATWAHVLNLLAARRNAITGPGLGNELLRSEYAKLYRVMQEEAAKDAERSEDPVMRAAAEAVAICERAAQYWHGQAEISGIAPTVKANRTGRYREAERLAGQIREHVTMRPAVGA